MAIGSILKIKALRAFDVDSMQVIHISHAAVARSVQSFGSRIVFPPCFSPHTAVSCIRDHKA